MNRRNSFVTNYIIVTEKIHRNKNNRFFFSYIAIYEIITSSTLRSTSIQNFVTWDNISFSSFTSVTLKWRWRCCMSSEICFTFLKHRIEFLSQQRIILSKNMVYTNQRRSKLFLSCTVAVTYLHIHITLTLNFLRMLYLAFKKLKEELK